MNAAPLPRITLPNGITLDETILRQLTWAGLESGTTWLLRLPNIIQAWCDRWHITLEDEFPEPGYNLVLYGTSTLYGPVVIKTSPPHEEVTAEIEALRANHGPGIVKLIDADPSVSILMEERVMPGTSLRSFTASGAMTDVEATEIAAACMQRYWTPDPKRKHLFSLDRWFKALYDYRDRYPSGGGLIPHDLLQLAILHANHLLITEEEKFIIHGDLHHGNILRGMDNDWIIIDPKGLVGERGYDIGQWMLNPFGLHQWANLGEVLSTRLDIFSDRLCIDRYRLWQWSLVQSVLSECWTLEGSLVAPEGLHALEVTRVLAGLPEAAAGLGNRDASK